MDFEEANSQVDPLSRLTICRMRNRRFSKDIRAINFRFRKEEQTTSARV